VHALQTTDRDVARKQCIGSHAVIVGGLWETQLETESSLAVKYLVPHCQRVDFCLWVKNLVLCGAVEAHQLRNDHSSSHHYQAPSQVTPVEPICCFQLDTFQAFDAPDELVIRRH